MGNFYTYAKNKWLRGQAQCEVLTGNPTVVEFQNAIILPLKRTGNVGDIWAGGVCDDNFNFIAGQSRTMPVRTTNKSCLQSYIPEELPEFVNETVVFGGVLTGQFGHALCDATSRMWWYAQNQSTPHKIVFLKSPGNKAPDIRFLELAGFQADEIEIITKPTQFAKVIVPDETMFGLSGKAYKQWREFFYLIQTNVARMSLPKSAEKVYLTRTRFRAESEDLNEKYYETFYAQRGYEVISPETLSLAEQIHVIQSADDIVCTAGTLSHMLMFSKKNAKLTVLLRTPEEPFNQQFIIDKLFELNVDYIEATRNLLPVTHSLGVPLFMPTEYFVKYLDERKITYSPADVTCDMRDFAYDFLCTWVNIYSSPAKFTWIKNNTAIDFLDSLSASINGVRIDRSRYANPDVVSKEHELRKKLEEKEKELWVLKQENKALKTQIAMHVSQDGSNVTECNGGIKTSPWFIRKVHGGIQCVKDNGFVYTWHHFWGKVGNKLRK